MHSWKLGDTVPLAWYTGTAGQSPVVMMMRMSDGFYYDFTSESFVASPTQLTATMSESSEVAGFYTWDFDSSLLSSDTDIKVLYKYGSSVGEEHHSFVLPIQYSPQATLALDAASDTLYISAWLDTGVVIIDDPTSIVVNIRDYEGDVVIGPLSSLVSVDGIFGITYDSPGLTDNRAYLVEVNIVYEGYTYSRILPFITVGVL